MSKDYRLPENRREMFVKWMTWAIVHEDCDPALYMTNYLFDRFELNIEQRFWIAWIYGTTYQLPTTWVIHNEFPDMELVDLQRLSDWNNRNYKRLRYQVDTKWNKGHLPAQFNSYRDWVFSTASSQRERFAQLCQGTPEENYSRLTKEISGLHKFGRYTTWFYLQTLKQCVGLKIEPTSLLLEDIGGSKSHRNGLLYALGMEGLIDKPLTQKHFDILNKAAAEILDEVKALVKPELRHKVDFFAMETCLCSFRKIFRKHHTRWMGYYLARQAEEIAQVEADGWSGICWRPLWQARTETLEREIMEHRKEDQPQNTFLDSGELQYWNTKQGLHIFT